MPAMAEGVENVLPCDSARPIDADVGIEQYASGQVKLKTGTGGGMESILMDAWQRPYGNIVQCVLSQL